MTIVFKSYIFLVYSYSDDDKGLDTIISEDTLSVWRLRFRAQAVKENGRLQKYLRLQAYRRDCI